MSRRSVLVPLLFSLALLASSAFGQQATTTTATLPKLEYDHPIEKQLAANETHSYQVDLSLNQYVEVWVDQRGIDIAMSAYDPKGQKLVDLDVARAGDQEAIALLAEQAGPYRVEIRASSPKVPPGRYEIKIQELRNGTPEDKYALEAGKLTIAAMQLEKQGAADSFRQAIAKYQESLPLWRLARQYWREANITSLIGVDYTFLNEKQKALDFATQGLQLAEAVARESTGADREKAIKVHGYALDILGKVHNQFGDKKKALEYFNQALALHKQIKNRIGELDAIGNIASAYQMMGDFQKALALTTEAGVLAAELGDHLKEGSILNNMCVLNEDLGDFKQALDYCNRALEIRHTFNDRIGEATTLGNLGYAHSSVGDYQRALDFYQRAHDLYKLLENTSGQGIQLNNIGWVYGTLGDYDKAIEFYNKAIQIFTTADDQYRLGNVLTNLAVCYSGLEDYRKALELHLRVLPMRRAVNNNNGAAVSLRHIATAYARLGEKQKALDYYQQSIQLLRQNPRQLTAALRLLGSLYGELGQQENAISSLNEALQVARNIGDRLNEASALAALARVERDRGDLKEAKHLTETALAAIESLRVNLMSQQLRATFFASARSVYEFYVDVLVRLHQQDPSAGFDVLAFQASENARARSLLELLMEAKSQIREGTDVALVERERKVRQAISFKAEQQMRLLSAKQSDEDTKSGAQELDRLANEYEDIQMKIRQASPRYAALTQPVPLTLKEIQSKLLDENTVLLEYSLGEDKSFGWVVTTRSLKNFELPKRAEVEKAARRFYDLVKSSGENAPDLQSAAGALSQMLLGPVASELRNKRLLIVAEGVLQYVPFSALSDPDGSDTPLIVKHEIVTLPSASVLGVLRNEANQRAAAPKSIAVFADPVFDSNDARFQRKTTVAAHADASDTAAVKRSAEESGLGNFNRLRFSRDEAAQIMKFAPRDRSFEALDFAANRVRATSKDLQNYRIVHFATHGIINSRHAELSGIVLSLVDQNGKPQDGFLRLYDVYNMNLQADLVVLSACQTALGRDIKGEGLIGLTRAFMYAGATRIVASLWQTDDRGNAVLMGRFYEDLLSRHTSPAQALRNAQISMLQDKRWRHPRYWAAFTIQGEWK